MYHQYHTNFMCGFIIKMLFRDRYTEDKNYKGSEHEQQMITQWLNYDKSTLDVLVEDSFFDEYLYRFIRVDPTLVKKRGLIACISKLGYPGLEFYVYFKVLAFAASLLELSRTHMLWYYLCYEDLIEIIEFNRYNSILSLIYRKFGWQWFSTNKYGTDAQFDVTLYKWAYYAILSEQKMFDCDMMKLKTDVVELYLEFSRKNYLSKPNQYKDTVFEYITNEVEKFQKIVEVYERELEEKRNREVTELRELSVKKDHTIVELQNDKKTLLKAFQYMKKDIFLIQNDPNIDIATKIDKILYNLYKCIPNKLTGDVVKKKFGDVWANLSEYSQEDIIHSLEMFEMMQDSEFSTLALLRSVERELELNVFQPFRESELFKNIEDFSCTFKKVEGTHKSLQRSVTLGSIPFIGRDVNNERYIQESSVLQAFAEFLGDKKEVFTEICRSIDQYKIDNGMKSIVDLRNGIAHGDATVTEFCDESCYHDICKFIYEPPIQIMFSIILHSLKGK